jgi:L-threonylcarbamoyladenylate synthase
MDNSNEIAVAADLLRAGELVAFPTETVYGLGADATNDLAVAKVYAAKNRPAINPLIVHAGTTEAALALGAFDKTSAQLAHAFWPGPLTLVVPRAAGCPVSLLASAGLPSIALRVPAHSMALDMLRALNGPVVAPSANPSGRISPTTAAHVREGLGDAVAMVLDGGACHVGVESTVVRITSEGPYLLRPGGIASEEIEKVLGRRLLAPTPNDMILLSPGQMLSHYAPRAAVRLDATEPLESEAYLGFGPHAHGPYSLSVSGDIVEAAANLFRLLHEIDATHPLGIAVAPIPLQGLGEAINDRLQRAAAPRSTS